ncbi:hypothetical protein ZIOFF_060533 [Zingiber officinale]|uniref:Uncharacterized protein n=1 Tax=Zingiber officinale TaxID=94328 RepID=A0A8J5FCT4_ZINOF|nr:hypothetical protein ZIOFF_060533 [Zingiber officinale]
MAAIEAWKDQVSLRAPPSFTWKPPTIITTIIMGIARRENGVLKLVHPGGFVEVHRKPMAVAEIMAKNPRHYVTRPEVFKNPRLVVRPDAQLNTGDVFYIVPNHTLYRLQASQY